MWIAPDKAIHLAANSIARPMVPRYNRICGKDLRAIFPPLLITLLGLMTGPSPQKICMDTTCILIDNTPHLQDPGRPRIYGKRRFKYIYLPSYSPFWIQLSVLVKVLVRCREVWHRRQRKGQGNPQTLSPALIATPGKGILFWALLSGRRNVICFWRKSSLQCMRLTSVYWFKFCSRQYNDLHRSSTQLSVHRNAPSNTEEIGFPGHGFFFRRTIKCPA